MQTELKVHKEASSKVNYLIGVLIDLVNAESKNDYFLSVRYLCLCLRKNGSFVNRIWIEKTNIGNSKLDSKLSDYEFNSIEVEFLHSPIKKVINPNNKNEINNLRGLKGFEFSMEGKTKKYTALQSISQNRSINSIICKHLKDSSGSSFNIQNRIELTLFDSKQVFIGNCNGEINAKGMFRGNEITCVETLSKDNLISSIRSMSNWMFNQIQEDGGCQYKYWPSKGEYSDANNAIRQFMATICLNRSSKVFNNPKLKELAYRNLVFNLESMYRQKGEIGYIWLDDSAKLGSISLAALAIIESPYRDKFKKELNALDYCIKFLTNDDGSFNTFLIPKERTDNQNFYSGEALLYLATKYKFTKSTEVLDSIISSFSHYKEWHLSNRNPAFVPWHTQAYYIVWKETKLEKLKDFIFEMNDWLLSMQQWNTAQFPDMKGRFYDPKRPNFGPPHASSTGVYLEGLIDAYNLALEVNDLERISNYRNAILRGIRSVVQLTFRTEVDCFYIKDPVKVLGGVRTTVYDNTIRIDNVQHALMAFFKTANSFCDDDYVSLSDKEEVKLNNFRRLDYEIPFYSISLEIEKNKELWGFNTSREDNLKVQRETNTIFLRSAKKPLPNGVMGENFHVDCETNVASNFPVLMDTLYQFAKSVNGCVARATIVRLKPGGRVYPHIDEGDYYKYRDRYHIVVKSLDGSEMVSGDEFVTWKQGEFWWFDNKKCHEAFNQSSEYRVHIIFDILPDLSKGLVKNIVDKYKLVQASGYYREEKIFSHLIDGREVELSSPILNGNKQESVGEIFVKNYKTNDVLITEHDNVFLLGNKFVVVDKDFRVLESSLPTYHQKPDENWAGRKKPFISSLLAKEVIEVDYPVAIVANSSWKNYWHWHIQCLPSIKAIQNSDIGDEVKFIVPRLNSWRSASLACLGIGPDRIIKAHDSIIKMKRAYRPNLLNKQNQANTDPFVIDTFDSIKKSVIDQHELSRKPFRKLYVSRQDCLERRKLSNEKQLISALKLLGFEVVVPGEMTYLEQVVAFSDADIVVGAHGAGLTNIGFCKSNTVLIELFPKYFLYDEKMAYYTLASIKKMKYLAYISDELSIESDYARANRCLNNKVAGNFDWVIDIGEVIEFIRKAELDF